MAESTYDVAIIGLVFPGPFWLQILLKKVFIQKLKND